MSIIHKMQYKIKPYDWQFKAMSNAEAVNEYGLLAEMGSGKSGALVNILRIKYNQNRKVMRTIIFSPLVTLYNWKNEFAIHSDIKDVVVLDKAARKVKDFEKKVVDKDCIVVMNYEAVQTDRFYKLLEDWKPEIIVCDEMHLLKNYKSKRAKKIIKLGDKAKYRFGLTGTPILNTPMDIYNQYRFLDKGATFGKSFFAFRAEYFVDSNAGWSNKPGHFPKFVPIEHKFSELTDKIYKKAIRVTKDECLDLPPLVVKRMYVEMTKEQGKYYKQMKDEFITFVKDAKTGENKAVVAQLALTKALRLQQIVCGFATTEEGEEISFESVPRLEVTRQLLTELVPSNKVIVWCAFKHDYKMIGKLCEELNIKHGFITGEQTLEDKQEVMMSLKNDPDFRVVIANRRSGGIGVNLVEATYSIVYSRNFSLGEELQSEARNHRGGSEKWDRIVKINLCTKDTIDETVLEALSNKQDVSDKIIDMKF